MEYRSAIIYRKATRAEFKTKPYELIEQQRNDQRRVERERGEKYAEVPNQKLWNLKSFAPTTFPSMRQAAQKQKVLSKRQNLI